MALTHPRVVLLLGAGFSAEAGLPLMKDFGQISDAELKEQLKIATQSTSTVVPEAARSSTMLVEAGRVFTGFRDHCRTASKLVDFDPDNMEHIYCTAEAIRESHRRGGTLHEMSAKISMSDQECDIDYVIEQIRLWLWKMYQQLPAVTAADPKEQDTRSKPYRELIRLLKDLDFRGRLTILTTNYDLVIEHFAWAGGFICGYPMQTDHDLWIKHPRKRYIDFAGSSHPSICKLHGSVNFFEGRYPKVDGDLLGEDPWFSLSAELAEAGDYYGGSHVSTERPAILAIDGIWALRARYGPSVVPVIIPPTHTKLQAKTWLRETWGKAVDELSYARLIVVIGYSMPESDGFMRAMLQAAMVKREPGKELTVCVVDPDPKTQSRYEQIFGRLGTNFISMRKLFRDAIGEKGELPDLLKRYATPT